MDSQERPQGILRDFFEDSVLPLRLPLPPSEVGDICDLQDPSLFNLEDSIPQHAMTHRLVPADPSFDDCASIREEHDIEDTNPLDEFFLPHYPAQPFPQQAFPVEMESQGEGEEDCPSQKELEDIITFLMQYSNNLELELLFRQKFSGRWESSVVQQLVAKFRGLKKTKEQLVKYCMRKAFKFILELPKNHELLPRAQSEKFSFAKSKERFLKKVSDEKSMNAKFLRQIFHQGDFSADYSLFLKDFEYIMVEDNKKKVKNLAEMLRKGKGKRENVVEVKRMPWTNAILQRVLKISLEMLKYAG